MRVTATRRGTALIQVLVLVMIASGVLLVVLNSTGVLYTQTKSTTESSIVRNESRGGVHAAAAFLSKDLRKGTAFTPIDNPALWAGDGSPANPYYVVLVGRGPNLLLDTTGTYYTPGAGGAVADFATGGAGSARALLTTPPAVDFGLGGDPEFAVRVEYKVISGTDFYYEVTSLARASNQNHASRGPMVLSMQAALVPEAPQPWEFGMAGLNQVQVTGNGTLGMIDTDGKINTAVATNGSISKN